MENELKIGDVVFINSEPNIKMTILDKASEIAILAYYNKISGEMEKIQLPFIALTKCE